MSTTNANTRTNKHPVQLAATVVAAVFLLVGLLGFVPGITTEYDGMTFAGHHSTAMLLGVFHVSILHNIVHLLFGIVGLVLARTVLFLGVGMIAAGATLRRMGAHRTA